MATRSAHTNVSVKPGPAVAAATDFPIVGIGASAGGLDAFEQFFRNMPTDSGMAFVLVSHLDPDHDSLLTEILQRTTSMPVVQVVDQMRVEPNCVYAIPPNHDLNIFHGALQLTARDTPSGTRMVIDTFLRALAEDQGSKAIGIILSGTGGDGTQGLHAIRAAGGITLVQEPSTAKYDGMPSSAIQAGNAMFVLPVEQMPAQLLNRSSVHPQKEPPASENQSSGLNRILMLLRSTTGHDFAQYKQSTIGRRIERRMAMHNIEDMEIYARYAKEHPAEVQLLFKELLINVTSFFRDAEAFAILKQDILPLLFEGKPEGYVFRVWVAGCASGEEAYSIAMLLREYGSESGKQFKVQLYSTDLDEDAIAVARAGIYPAAIAQDIAPERLQRFFDKHEVGYRVKKELREMVVFAIQNVIKDPPFTKLDLLCCRNLMIYLGPELQHRLIPTFHYSLKSGGVLFLSPSESIGNHPELFTPLNRKWKFYRATHSLTSTRAVMYGGVVWSGGTHLKEPAAMTPQIKEINFAELTKRALLQSFAPASVVTDLQGNILFVHGDTGKYLRPAPGHATLNVIEMARDGLQLELRTAIDKAKLGEPTLSKEVAIKDHEDFLSVSFTLRPLHEANTEGQLLLLSFQDVAHSVVSNSRSKSAQASREKRRIDELERELAYAKESQQTYIEEVQATSEEFQSANEELQSTNEELQSTNEELETSQEELQSVNEELITVNAELQGKIELLTRYQNDMKNLLDCTSIATIFLDQHLNIQRYTREATKVYRLVASDQGRALGDIRSNIVADDLLPDAQAVLDSLIPREREVRITTGETYLLRIQPYRTLDNVIAGVVLTLTDITQRILAEATAEAARKLAEGIVNTVREPLIVLDAALHVVSASDSFYCCFNTTPEETVGKLIYELGNHQWDIPTLRSLLEHILPNNPGFEGFLVEHDFPEIGHCRMMLNARRIVSEHGETQRILLAMERVPNS
ncbi:Chemotaxis protein methyltransferase [Ferriphaselus amnicola]|uniref:Chemotaxis protein methyltransferase n=1 Tax=Ferriphaselus amnicola TaxID=1188319 RepID=A0A2Z6G8R1_9PROT|nr:chemotaxis protein CheB [Ferriphaselus amnicola]BBE49799.1 Chemotaxis protein methyltransferase [Ferriphaselus amnicola]